MEKLTKEGAESIISHQLKVILENSYELRVFFEEELKSIYWIDKAILKMLSKIGKNSISDDLFMSLDDHVNIKEEQLGRVEGIFVANALNPEAIKCKAVDVLIKELEQVTSVTDLGIVRDSWIISVMQKIEFYVITSYATLANFANLLGQNDVAHLLKKTLDEEKAYTLELSKISELIHKDLKGVGEIRTTTKAHRIVNRLDFELIQGIHRHY